MSNKVIFSIDKRVCHCYYSGAVDSTESTHRNLQKLEKSSWQGGRCVLEWKSSPSGGRSVPCKLNNVRQTITPWTIINGLFKRFWTNNSQRKFLSNIARSKLFKNLIWALLWEFRYNFLRVWSWLRTNAGGVPNTCKSNGAILEDPSGSEGLA